ncbi:MAG TPA: hypothetical protein QF624_04445 [Dehalococcoidia bacterium]|nr:hypothetical protein [Dehalococcoidia bacterium]
MRGYEPEFHSRDAPGGCGEFWMLTRAAFEVLLPPVILISTVLGLVMTAIFLLTSGRPWLAVIPLVPIAIGLVLLSRRDKRIQRELEEEARGGPPQD